MNSLAEELLQYILDFIDTKQLHRYLCICRRWHHAITDVLSRRPPLIFIGLRGMATLGEAHNFIDKDDEVEEIHICTTSFQVAMRECITAYINGLKYLDQVGKDELARMVDHAGDGVSWMALLDRVNAAGVRDEDAWKRGVVDDSYRVEWIQAEELPAPDMMSCYLVWCRGYRVYMEHVYFDEEHAILSGMDLLVESICARSSITLDEVVGEGRTLAEQLQFLQDRHFSTYEDDFGNISNADLDPAYSGQARVEKHELKR